MDAPTFEVPKNLDIPLISTCKKYGVDGKPNKQCRRNSDSSSKLAFTFFQFVIFQQNWNNENGGMVKEVMEMQKSIAKVSMEMEERCIQDVS